MLLRILPGVISILQCASLIVYDTNATESKSKRGILDTGNGSPTQYHPGYNQVRSLSQDPSSTPNVKYHHSEPAEQNNEVPPAKNHVFDGQAYHSPEGFTPSNQEFSPALSNQPKESFNRDIPNNQKFISSDSAVQDRKHFVPAYREDSKLSTVKGDFKNDIPRQPAASPIQASNQYVPTYTDRPRIANANLINRQTYYPPQYQTLNQQQNVEFQNAHRQQPNHNSPQILNNNNQVRPLQFDSAQRQQFQNSPIPRERSNAPQTFNIQNDQRQQTDNLLPHLSFQDRARLPQPNALQPQHFQNDPRQRIIPLQNPAPQNYPVFHPKLPHPVSLLGNGQQANNIQNGIIRPQQNIQLQQRPNLYVNNPVHVQSQGNFAPTNIVQSPQSLQYRLPAADPNNQPPRQLGQHNNIQSKIQIPPPEPSPHRPTSRPQSYHTPSPIAQITQNFNSIEQGFSPQQNIDDDVPPQHQIQPQDHPQQRPQQQLQIQPQYIPQQQPQTQPQYRPLVPHHPSQNQGQHYTRLPQLQNYPIPNKPINSSPTIVRENTNAPDPEESQEQSHNCEANNEPNEQNEERPEVNQEEDEESVTDEEEEKRFESGYEDAAKGFPTFNTDQFYEDRGKSQFEEESDERFGTYRPARYEDYHSDDEHPPHFHDKTRDTYFEEHDIKKNRFFGDHDVESSRNNENHEPRENPHKEDSHPQQRYYDQTAHQTSKKPKNSIKHSRQHRKIAKDVRADSNPLKKHVTKPRKSKPNGKSGSDSTVQKYEHNFEPIKHSASQDVRRVSGDSEGRQSIPHPTKKIYKENWYVSNVDE